MSEPLLTTATLAACVGCSETRAAAWIDHITAAAACYDINTPLRLAAFLAQAAHESAGLRVLDENLNYDAAGLLRIWPNRFSKAEAQEYARNPERIANKVYGGRTGNGPESSGDGWRFRGGGIFQLTGRDDYRLFAQTTGVDAENRPELVRIPGLPAAMSAAWEWNRSKLWAFADTGDIDTVSKKLNGGTNGLEERRVHYIRACKILGV